MYCRASLLALREVDRDARRNIWKRKRALTKRPWLNPPHDRFQKTLPGRISLRRCIGRSHRRDSAHHAPTAKRDARGKKLGLSSKKPRGSSSEPQPSSKKLGTPSKKLDTRSKKLGTRSKKLGARSKKLDTPSKKLGAPSN
ncbi:hypothetical protein FUT88_07850 [Ralstonia sp. TCR112]|uniref:hypothetical protein n=1 Tax=Ralstonia sp. TCR112 TaxID=2601730 RepID=UPI0011BDF4FB|nr:hypothetical protein [Ralstonia sp. TCR112]TXD61563.1 hypothetical protein FUT88_07850 [Ralstonia sp. TCR112]